MVIAKLLQFPFHHIDAESLCYMLVHYCYYPDNGKAAGGGKHFEQKDGWQGKVL